MAANKEVFRRSCSIKSKNLCPKIWLPKFTSMGCEFLQACAAYKHAEQFKIVLPKRLRKAVEHLEIRKFIS